MQLDTSTLDAREEDPIPLLGGSFPPHVEDVRDHTVLRIVKVVTAFCNVRARRTTVSGDAQTSQNSRDVLVIALEEEMARRDLKDLEGIRRCFGLLQKRGAKSSTH